MSPFAKNEIQLLMALPMESQGLFERHGIHVNYTGIGKVNAAFTATEAIQKSKCKVVINLGTAGSKKFKTHDLVEVSSFVQRDMNITAMGFAMGETPFDSIPGAVSLIPFFDHLPMGVCGTGDQFETGSPQMHYDLVDMEGYAIAKVCQRLGVRCISLKYITDGADENAKNDWQENLVSGAKKLFEYYGKIVKVS